MSSCSWKRKNTWRLNSKILNGQYKKKREIRMCREKRVEKEIKKV